MSQGIISRIREFFNPPSNLVPVNGLKGLRWLRWDIPAGIALSPVALVYAFTVASLSHAPLMAGVMSAIIGTIVGCWLGGSYLGVCGAAAALSFFISRLIDGLGHGDQALGFILSVPIVFVIGAVLYVFGRLGWARFLSVASHGVAEGMMCWIGFNLMIVQIAVFFGLKFTEKHSLDPLGIGVEKLKIDAPVWGNLIEGSHRFTNANFSTLFIGVSTLILLLVMLWVEKYEKKGDRVSPFSRLLLRMSLISRKIYGVLPAQAIVAGYALLMSYLFGLDPRFCVQLPDHPFRNMIEMPHFGQLLSALQDKDNLNIIMQYGISLLLVDGFESILSSRGIDAKDPYRRMSDLNQGLRTIGIANMLGAFFHSLTHIWEGLKSTMNMLLGAKTLWSGAISGVLVAIYVWSDTTRAVLNHLPLSGLAAIIAVTAGALCWPPVWNKFRKMGVQEFSVFVTCFVICGIHGEIIHGVLASFLLECVFCIYGATIAYRRDKDIHPGILRVAISLFKNPIGKIEKIGEVTHIHLNAPLVGFNTHFLQQAVKEAKQVIVHRGRALYVDSSANTELDALNVRLGGELCTKSIVEQLRPTNDHPHATRIYCRRISQTEDHPGRRRIDGMELA